MMRTAVIFILLIALLAPAAFAVSLYPDETPEQKDARMAWWRDARFGMFIHWGIYSVPAGTWDEKRIDGIGEWIMHHAKIPLADYSALAKSFNPVKFDADAWVRLAKDAGMKYIIITSKHHDGFAMFDSDVSDYNIFDATPFKRDPLKELSEACKKYDMRLGFYYSQAQDWGHPGGAAIGGHWDPAQDGDMDAYLRDVAVPQVKEILTKYGPISVLWYDTPADMTPERAALFAPLMPLQPGLIINNRLGGGYEGDLETPEQTIPATGMPGRDWETCMTMNDTWGFKSYDDNWKTTEDLIRKLVDIASKGGNFLLNVGPTSEGLIPQPSIERLQAMGAWMKVNGEAIYGVEPSPFKNLPWGRCTRKDGKLYLHVFDWPTDGKLIVPMQGIATAAALLTAPDQPLALSSGDKGVTITVPATAPDAIATVIALTVEGDVLPAQSLISQAEDGSISLAAQDAELTGGHVKLEGVSEMNVGFWTDPGDTVSWNAKLERPGAFEVSLTYACDPVSVGSAFVIEAGGAKMEGTIKGTGGWGDYQTISLGILDLPAAGPITITVKPVSMPNYAVMNLRNVVLKPVGK